jgi:hypothetical protein
MRKWSLSILFVVVALPFSAWGNVIAAAFCPRFSLNCDCCVNRGVQQAKQVKNESSCHHEMAGMKMDDRMTETASSNGAPASCGRTAGILACADAPDTGAQCSRVQITTESLSAQSALDPPARSVPILSRPLHGLTYRSRLDPSTRVLGYSHLVRSRTGPIRSFWVKPLSAALPSPAIRQSFVRTTLSAPSLAAFPNVS